MQHLFRVWLPLVGLCGATLALGVAAQDRSLLPLVVGLVFAAGMCCLVLWRWASLSMRTILFYAVVFRIALFGLPPSLSDDAYRYVWDGLVQQQGVNPYRYPPRDPALATLQDLPIYEKLNSPEFISVYPPVSQLLFRTGALFYVRGWWQSHYAIKGLLVLAELLAVFLLARMVSARLLILYALNPLVLLETAGQAHTESFLVLMLVLVVYLVRYQRGRWASVCLAVAGWVKLFPFFFFPFLWRRFGWRAVWPGTGVAAALALPFAAPYVLSNVVGSLDLYARYFEFNAGLYYGLKEMLRWYTGDDWSKQLGPLLRTVFLVGLPLLYALDFRYNWPVARAMLFTIGGYLVLTTTVHPWYLLSVIVLCVLLGATGWHWLWLGLCSAGTYLLYSGGPYWSFVTAGWGGWTLLVTWRYWPRLLQSIMMVRARSKYRWIRPYLSTARRPLHVLDLGCAEGYVGQQIRESLGASVVLADVTDMNRTQLPFTRVPEDHLPWESGTYDVVVLCLVLHHTKDAEAVLCEALRVCRGRVIVVESTYSSPSQLRLLTFFDKLANRTRSSGKMKAQERQLHFRTVAGWRAIFAKFGARILAEEKRGASFATQAVFVLQPPAVKPKFPKLR